MSDGGTRRIDIEEYGDATVVRFIDRRILDETNIQIIGIQLAGLVDEDGRRKIVIDFNDVEYLSSAALGKLITLDKKVRAAKGHLRLCSIRPEIYEVFKITKLDKVFNIFDDPEKARRRRSAAATHHFTSPTLVRMSIRPTPMASRHPRPPQPGVARNNDRGSPLPVEEFAVSIPSDTAEGLQVQERIVAILESMNYPERDVFGIRLALEEALVNAIKHGNRLDANKRVHVNCRIARDVIRIEIEDEGAGFRLEDVPDPTQDDNLERPCGRGIMLMKHFLNCVQYNDLGNKVLLEKCRDADA
ncbi:MAG: anti-sigma factor antagonist [Planctomycetaceae bacterium]